MIVTLEAEKDSLEAMTDVTRRQDVPLCQPTFTHRRQEIVSAREGSTFGWVGINKRRVGLSK